MPEFECEKCGKICKSRIGFLSHSRACKAEPKEEFEIKPVEPKPVTQEWKPNAEVENLTSILDTVTACYKDLFSKLMDGAQRAQLRRLLGKEYRTKDDLVVVLEQIGSTLREKNDKIHVLGWIEKLKV